ENGRIMHEGINEAGSAAEFTAVGTSYATHGEPMIPLYIFYSMFGFQRTGDSFWAAGDQMARGFVIGATAGRTTLTGEGLQHADGHSHLLAATNPAVVAYDPAFAYELAHIVVGGLDRMYGPDPDNVYFYITVYNEPIHQPAQPENLDVPGLLQGAYLYREAKEPGEHAANILVSGVTMGDGLRAQDLLAQDWNVAANVYSVTSWNELARDGIDADRDELREGTVRKSYITELLSQADGPFVAASDYMRGVPEQIRPYVPGTYVTLGADGFGFSDTRTAARRFFNIDAESIAVGVLVALARDGKIDRSVAADAAKKYQITDVSAAPVSLADPGSA
ncbi:MAG: pyruvate dehydrogenase (acetyl-transferring), homodimeric type, partial [Gordonia sp. (in: high G+C Gram-positive bacteria)]